MIITSFFTPNYSGEEAAFLSAAEKYARPGDIIQVHAVDSRGSWRLNCGMKPAHILDVLVQGKQPVLWVDIDGRFRSAWDLNLDVDFAAWFIPNRKMQPAHVPGGSGTGHDGIASGTMWFNHTDKAIEFLQSWFLAERGQGQWEQQILGEVWYKWDESGGGLKTKRLHQRYCKVFDCQWFDGKGPVVIEHMQASRRLKRGRG